jgi:hypothetical protein
LEKSSKIYWKNHQENYLRGTPSGWLTSWSLFWIKMLRNGRECNGSCSSRKCRGSSPLWGQSTNSTRKCPIHPSVSKLPRTSKENASLQIWNFSVNRSKPPEEKNLLDCHRKTRPAVKRKKWNGLNSHTNLWKCYFSVKAKNDEFGSI